MSHDVTFLNKKCYLKLDIYKIKFCIISFCNSIFVKSSSTQKIELQKSGILLRSRQVVLFCWKVWAYVVLPFWPISLVQILYIGHQYVLPTIANYFWISCVSIMLTICIRFLKKKKSFYHFKNYFIYYNIPFYNTPNIPTFIFLYNILK